MYRAPGVAPDHRPPKTFEGGSTQATGTLCDPDVNAHLEDGPMNVTQYSLETLVVRIQNEFLERPTLRLTLPQAVQRFGIEKTTGGAVLDALVAAGVLAKTQGGAYSSFVPREIDRARSARSRARASRRAVAPGTSDSLAGNAA